MTDYSVSAYGRYGDQRGLENPSPEQIREFVSALVDELITEEFSHPDYEHSEVSVTHEESGYSVSAYLSGLICLEKLEGEPEEERQLIGLSVEELQELLRLLAHGRLDEVMGYDWKDEVQRPLEDLFLYAGEPDMTPLHRAAAKGDPAWLEQEISRAENVDLPGKFGETPLHTAAMAGEAEACRLLIAAGADLDAPGQEGETVEESAEICEFGAEGVLEVLRAARLDYKTKKPKK